MSDKADQTDVVAQLEAALTRSATLETQLTTEKTARVKAETDLAAASTTIASLNTSLSTETTRRTAAQAESADLKAKEQDLQKRAAAITATAGITTGREKQTQSDPEQASGTAVKKNYTALCAKKLGVNLASMGLVVVAFCLFLMPQAHGQLAKELRGGPIQNIPTSVALSATSTLTTSTFRLMAGEGVGLFLKFYGNNVDVGNVTVKFGASQNGTLLSTETLATWVVTSVGTNVVLAFTNIPPAFIGNAPYLVVKSIQNGNTNSILGVSLSAYTPVSPR